MKTIMLPRAFAAALLCSLLAACGTDRPAPVEAPAPPVTSVAQADQQLIAVRHERAGIEARYAERERTCYAKFFVNRCLDEAREHRRTALAAQRAIEIQAEHFKRQTAAAERDRNLAEAEKHYQEEEARLAAEPPKPAPAVTPAPPPRKPSAPGRIAKRNARLKSDQAKEAASADKRAENVRDFERRKAESAERQRKVAQRKAERAAKAAKEAEAGKK